MKRIGLKKWFVFAAVLLTGMYFVACSDDKDDGGGEVNPLEEIFDVDKSELLYGMNEETISMELTSNVSWTVVSTANWCEPSVMAGNGNAEINVAVTENDNVNERRCQLILKGGKKKLVLDVVQLGDEVRTIVYIDGVEIKDGDDANTAQVDFESKQYLVNIVSNTECNISFQGNGWLQYRESAQTGYSAPQIHYLYDIFSGDNPSRTPRDASMTIARKMGDYSRTITIRQKEFTDFLRVFSDTVMVGSHFNVMELEARTSVHWDYELQGDHSWLSNWRERRNPVATYELGTRSRLLADVATNRDARPRECDVIFKYIVDGEQVTQKVKLIQLGYDGLKSDSLALMDIAKMNANQLSGLNVAWAIGYPITSWGNITIGVDNGEKRIVALQLANTWLCFELTASIANLTGLKSLNLAKNYLDGVLPEEMGRLVNLEDLDISENYCDVTSETPSYRITGIEEIPEKVFEGCTNLQNLNLSMNRLRMIPNSIGNLVNLQSLSIAGENELENVPDNDVFRALKQLKDLRLSDWKLWEGEFFDFIFDLPELQNITIFRITFKKNEQLGDHFDKLPNLTSFTCQQTNLGGSLPASILNCKDLNSLLLGGCEFSGALLPGLPDLEKLKVIDLSENLFTGEIPDSYAEFGLNLGNKSPRGNYTNLFLFGNQLEGSIPTAMLTCPMWSDKVLCWEPLKFICPQQKGFGFDNCK